MELSGIAAQQAIVNSRIGVAMVKAQHQAEASIVNMIAATVDGARGQNLNITV